MEKKNMYCLKCSNNIPFVAKDPSAATKKQATCELLNLIPILCSTDLLIINFFNNCKKCLVGDVYKI